MITLSAREPGTRPTWGHINVDKDVKKTVADWPLCALMRPSRNGPLSVRPLRWAFPNFETHRDTARTIHRAVHLKEIVLCRYVSVFKTPFNGSIPSFPAAHVTRNRRREW